MPEGDGFGARCLVRGRRARDGRHDILVARRAVATFAQDLLGLLVQPGRHLDGHGRYIVITKNASISMELRPRHVSTNSFHRRQRRVDSGVCSNAARDLGAGRAGMGATW